MKEKDEVFFSVATTTTNRAIPCYQANIYGMRLNSSDGIREYETKTIEDNNFWWLFIECVQQMTKWRVHQWSGGSETTNNQQQTTSTLTRIFENYCDRMGQENFKFIWEYQLILSVRHTEVEIINEIEMYSFCCALCVIVACFFFSSNSSWVWNKMRWKKNGINSKLLCIFGYKCMTHYQKALWKFV